MILNRIISENLYNPTYKIEKQGRPFFGKKNIKQP